MLSIIIQLFEPSILTACSFHQGGSCNIPCVLPKAMSKSPIEYLKSANTRLIHVRFIDFLDEEERSWASPLMNQQNN